MTRKDVVPTRRSSTLTPRLAGAHASLVPAAITRAGRSRAGSVESSQGGMQPTDASMPLPAARRSRSHSALHAPPKQAAADGGARVPTLATATARKVIAFGTTRLTPRWTAAALSGPIADSSRRPVQYQSRPCTHVPFGPAGRTIVGWSAPDRDAAAEAVGAGDGGAEGEEVAEAEEGHGAVGLPPLERCSMPLLRVPSLVSDSDIDPLARQLLRIGNVHSPEEWTALDGPYIAVQVAAPFAERTAIPFRVHVLNVHSRVLDLALSVRGLPNGAINYPTSRLAPGAELRADVIVRLQHCGEWLGAVSVGCAGEKEPLFELPVYVQAVVLPAAPGSLRLIRPRWTEQLGPCTAHARSEYHALPSVVATLRMPNKTTKAATGSLQSVPLPSRSRTLNP